MFHNLSGVRTSSERSGLSAQCKYVLWRLKYSWSHAIAKHVGESGSLSIGFTSYNGQLRQLTPLGQKYKSASDSAIKSLSLKLLKRSIGDFIFIHLITRIVRVVTERIACVWCWIAGIWAKAIYITGTNHCITSTSASENGNRAPKHQYVCVRFTRTF